MDTAAYQDGVISPYYDSLVAKLIAYGSDRAEAIARMKRALGMFVVEGIYTSIPLHQRILTTPSLSPAGSTPVSSLATAFCAIRNEFPVLRPKESRFEKPWACYT